MQPHTILWDLAVRGFNARRQKSETVTFSVFYRTQDQLQRWHRIGRFGVWTPEQARKEAQRVLRARDLGEDPSGARMAVRNSPTMAELCDEYQSDMQSGKLNGKKPSTIKSDVTRINKHIKPKLGKLKVATITQADLEAFIHQLSPGNARRILGLTGAIFTFAIKKKLRLDNPARGIETPKYKTRLKRLSISEYAQLGRVLSDGSNAAADIFLLLAISGWRSGEARLLKFSELDVDRRIATLGDTKSGQSVRPLSGAAIEIIQRQKRTSEYVFALQQGAPINKLFHHWEKLELDKTITPHVLRHSFASLAADMGLADHTIASLLGHTQRSITSRYIHGSDKALIAAADSVAVETLRLIQNKS
jgi:integrase